MEVPSTSDIKDIYPEIALSQQQQRWNSLLQQFEQEYGRSADFVSRSPGRVNVIGEHVDYSLYQCLPTAVTADVLLAVSIRNDSSDFTIANSDPDSFPRRTFSTNSDGDVTIDATSLEWSNYFKAGVRGACKLLQRKRSSSSFRPVGMEILVNGSVPAGGGLSSSAAFVCASALAVLKANGETSIDKTELVEIAIVAERAVGVNSGGLDQSASVFGLRDNALLVSFKPKLEVQTLQFPRTTPEMVFMIAQTFVKADKHTTGPIGYNLRVVECSLAAEVLAKIFKVKAPLPTDSGPLGISLRGFHDTYFQEKEGITDNTQTPIGEQQKQLDLLVKLVKDYLVQEEGYTREEISQILGISVDEINKRYTATFPVKADRFLLRQRALHVFSEAGRVMQFVSLMKGSGSGDQDVPAQLGALMNETQESCRDLYNCSCPELDELCQIAVKAGSLGSRLTGAGFGGCCVHLVPADKVDAVRDAFKREYYDKKFPDLSEDKLRDAVVVSKPGSGSLIYNVRKE